MKRMRKCGCVWEREKKRRLKNFANFVPSKSPLTFHAVCKHYQASERKSSRACRKCRLPLFALRALLICQVSSLGKLLHWARRCRPKCSGEDKIRLSLLHPSLSFCRTRKKKKYFAAIASRDSLSWFPQFVECVNTHSLVLIRVRGIESYPGSLLFSICFLAWNLKTQPRLQSPFPSGMPIKRERREYDRGHQRFRTAFICLPRFTGRTDLSLLHRRRLSLGKPTHPTALPSMSNPVGMAVTLLLQV